MNHYEKDPMFGNALECCYTCKHVVRDTAYTSNPAKYKCNIYPEEFVQYESLCIGNGTGCPGIKENGDWYEWSLLEEIQIPVDKDYLKGTLQEPEIDEDYSFEEFAYWVREMLVFEDLDWPAFAELACRRLCRLGLMQIVDNNYEETDL